VREGDFPAKSADVLQSAHAETGIHDEILFSPDVGLRLREELIVPVGQRLSPEAQNGQRG